MKFLGYPPIFLLYEKFQPLFPYLYHPHRHCHWVDLDTGLLCLTNSAQFFKSDDCNMKQSFSYRRACVCKLRLLENNSNGSDFGGSICLLRPNQFSTSDFHSRKWMPFIKSDGRFLLGNMTYSKADHCSIAPFNTQHS